MSDISPTRDDMMRWMSCDELHSNIGPTLLAVGDIIQFRRFIKFRDLLSYNCILPNKQSTGAVALAKVLGKITKIPDFQLSYIVSSME